MTEIKFIQDEIDSVFIS